MIETLVILVAIGILIVVLIAHMAQMAYMKGILAHFDRRFEEVNKRYEDSKRTKKNGFW